MNVLANITLDMQRPGYVIVYATQYDKLTRDIKATLVNAGAAWEVPSGTQMLVKYSKPDGTTGMYDSTEKNKKAYSISGNVVTFTMAQQALAVAGNVAVQLCFYNSSGQQLTTFYFTIAVQPSVINDMDIESGDYYNLMSGTMADMAALASLLKSGYGAPLTASTVAAMTNTDKIYVYTGSQTGYTKGNWYYYNGSSWVSGGVYNSAAIQTDTTFSIAGDAADAVATHNYVMATDKAITSGVQTIKYTAKVGAPIFETFVPIKLYAGRQYKIRFALTGSPTGQIGCRLYYRDGTYLDFNQDFNTDVTYSVGTKDIDHFYIYVNSADITAAGTLTITATGMSVLDQIDQANYNLAAAYSGSRIYNVGDFCIYQGGLYQRTLYTGTADGGWLNSAWTAYKVTEMATEVTDLKSDLSEILPEDLTSNTRLGWYIAIPLDTTIGTVIDVNNPTAGANLGYQVVPVKSGDVITATGRAAGGYAGYAVLDSEYRLLSMSGIIYIDAVIDITQDGYVVLNVNKLSDYYVKKGINKVEEVEGKISDAIAEVNKLTEIENINMPILYNLSPREYTLTRSNTALSLGSLSVGDVLSLTPVSAVYFGYAIINCEPGETFTIAANAGSDNLPWAFIDANNVITGIANNYRAALENIVAPENTNRLVIVANTNATVFISRGANIVGKLQGEGFNLPLTVVNGTISKNGSTTTAQSYRRTPDAILLKAGQTITMDIICNDPYAPLTEWDSNDNFVQTLLFSNGAGTYTYTFTAEKDTLVKICYYNSAGYKGTLSEPIPQNNANDIASIKTWIDGSYYEWERILNSVCCIGDSLTRGAYFVNGRDGSAIEQNYPYFFSKQSGVPTQNEGLGGSSPASRWGYFSTFDFTPFNAFFIWWGTNGGLTDTLEADGVIDASGNLIPDYTSYANTNTGCYCKTIGRIIEQVPHAKIFLATIFTTSGTGGAGATNTVIEKIAALYPNHVMGVVNCNDGTLYTLSSKKLTPPWVHIDNITHFSMVGNYYLAVHWLKAVRAIIAANPGRFEDIMEDILT